MRVYTQDHTNISTVLLTPGFMDTRLIQPRGGSGSSCHDLISQPSPSCRLTRPRQLNSRFSTVFMSAQGGEDVKPDAAERGSQPGAFSEPCRVATVLRPCDGGEIAPLRLADRLAVVFAGWGVERLRGWGRRFLRREGRADNGVGWDRRFGSEITDVGPDGGGILIVAAIGIVERGAGHLLDPLFLGVRSGWPYYTSSTLNDQVKRLDCLFKRQGC